MWIERIHSFLERKRREHRELQQAARMRTLNMLLLRENIVFFIRPNSRDSRRCAL